MSNDGVVFTARTRRYRRNAFGLSDMLGNVWDVDNRSDYVRAPIDGSAWEFGGDCALRVVRGGGWLNEPVSVRSANRFRFNRDVASHALYPKYARFYSAVNLRSNA